MKKLLILIIVALSITFTGCKPKEKKFDTYAYFEANPSCLQRLVEVENRKSPLAVQEYNKIKNNVIKIEFNSLVVTHGSYYACSGYFKTVWTIKSEYFGEEQYEYLIPCKNLRYDKNTESIIWETKWPDEHPFIEK